MLILGVPPIVVNILATNPMCSISSIKILRIKPAADAPKSLIDHQAQRYGGKVANSSSMAAFKLLLSQSISLFALSV
nr:hypothetical protein [Nostoc sp. LEGE 06077]